MVPPKPTFRISAWHPPTLRVESRYSCASYLCAVAFRASNSPVCGREVQSGGLCTCLSFPPGFLRSAGDGRRFVLPFRTDSCHCQGHSLHTNWNRALGQTIHKPRRLHSRRSAFVQRNTGQGRMALHILQVRAAKTSSPRETCLVTSP